MGERTEYDLRELRILVVNWRCILNPRAGGAEVHLHRVFSVLTRSGHEVTVLCSGCRGAPADGYVENIRYIRAGSEYSFYLVYKRSLQRLVRNDRFDLVVDDISKVPLGISRNVHSPTIAICHHVHGDSLYMELPRPLARYLAGKEAQLPDLYAETPILAVSDSTRTELIRLGLSPELIRCAHNGVDHDVFSTAEPIKSDYPLLAYLGRLRRYKNIECILRAFARIRMAEPNARLVIIGSGKHKKNLQRFAGQVSPAGVEFAGYLNDAEKVKLLSRAWVALAASVKEGWGICVIEANAAGTPVIASDVPGHRDSIRHGSTGLLYPYDDDRALAEAVLEVIRDNDLRQELSTNACQWARRFSWDTSAREFAEGVLHFYPQFARRQPDTPDEPGEPGREAVTSGPLGKLTQVSRR